MRREQENKLPLHILRSILGAKADAHTFRYFLLLKPTSGVRSQIALLLIWKIKTRGTRFIL